jgi:uncharacterized protein
MATHLSNYQKAGLFYALAMALSFGVVLFFRLALPQAQIVILVNMLTPLLAALLMLFVVTRDGYSREVRAGLGLGRSGWRMWGLAVVAPLLVLVVAYGLGWLSSSVPVEAPAQRGGFSGLLGNLLPNFLVGVVLALSEEIGFRGYLLPRLLGLGSGRALALSGFLHGTWHLPLIFLTRMYLTQGSRLLTIPFFLVLLTAAGMLYGALWLLTRSVWPGTILHAAFNAYLDVFTGLSVMSAPLAIYMVGESGLLTILATLLPTLWLIHRWQPRFDLTPVRA